MKGDMQHINGRKKHMLRVKNAIGMLSIILT
jgi:hypothetical protein